MHLRCLISYSKLRFPSYVQKIILETGRKNVTRQETVFIMGPLDVCLVGEICANLA